MESMVKKSDMALTILVTAESSSEALRVVGWLDLLPANLGELSAVDGLASSLLERGSVLIELVVGGCPAAGGVDGGSLKARSSQVLVHEVCPTICAT